MASSAALTVFIAVILSVSLPENTAYKSGASHISEVGQVIHYAHFDALEWAVLLAFFMAFLLLSMRHNSLKNE
jgi:hypothetical protein